MTLLPLRNGNKVSIRVTLLLQTFAILILHGHAHTWPPAIVSAVVDADDACKGHPPAFSSFAQSLLIVQSHPNRLACV